MAGLGSHTPRDPYTSSLNVLTRRQNVFRPKQYPLEGCMEERIKEGGRTRLWVGEGTSLPHKSRAQKQAVQIALPLAHCKLGRAPLLIYPFHGLYCAIWVHPTRALHHSNHKETVPETARADTSAARLPQRVEVEQPKQRSQQRCLRHLRQNRQTVKTVKTSTRYRARVTGPVQYQGLLESTRHRLFYVQNKGRLSS